MSAVCKVWNITQSAVVEVVPCELYLSVSLLTCCFKTTSAPRASGDSRFSVTVITFTFFAFQISIIGRSSLVFPPRDARTITSPSCKKPVAPCTASAGEINLAGRSIQHRRCAKCRQIIPECPQPQVPMRGALSSSSTAFEKLSSSKYSAISSMQSLSIRYASFTALTVSCFIRHTRFRFYFGFAFIYSRKRLIRNAIANSVYILPP